MSFHKLHKDTSGDLGKRKALNVIIENNQIYVPEDINTIRRFNGTIQETTNGNS
jgi:hypothetical protein